VITALLSDQHYQPELPNGYPVGETDFGFRAQCKSIDNIVYREIKFPAKNGDLKMKIQPLMDG
jgi:hypothetical protein